MKKIISLAVVLVCGVVLVGACSNSDQKSTEKDSTVQSNKTINTSVTEPSSKELYASGVYEVGTDIEPGSYYAVLTQMEYGDYDEGKNGVIYANIESRKPSSFELYNTGNKQRITLNKGDKLKLEENFQPKSWTVKLFNETDFQEYTKNPVSTSNSSEKQVTSTDSTEKTTDNTKQSSNPKSSEVSELLSKYDSFIQKIKETSETVSSMSEIESMNAVTDLLQEQTELSTNLDQLQSENLSAEDSTKLMNKSVDMLQEYTTLMNKLQAK